MYIDNWRKRITIKCNNKRRMFPDIETSLLYYHSHQNIGVQTQ